MEISGVLGNRVQSIFLTVPSSPLRPIKNSQSPSATTTTITCITTRKTTTTTLLSQAYNGPTIFSPNSSPKYTSISYEARQSAILDIQQCPDLQLALSRSGGLLRVQDLNGVMRHLGKLNRLHDLSQVFYWMQQNGMINFASYSSYMKLMGKSLHPVKALEIYNGIEDESTRNNVSVCNSVLSSLIKCGQFESSIKMFSQMKQDGLVPDIVTYSTVYVRTFIYIISQALRRTRLCKHRRLPILAK